MKKFFLAFVVALLPTLVAATEQSSRQTKKSEKTSTLRPTKNNPCAQYGAGFVQVEGSTTCIKVGSSVTFESGSRR